MKIMTSRVTEVPINSSTPKPYIQHSAKQTHGLDTDNFELSLNIDFQNVNEFFSALRDLYCLYKQKGHSYEDNLNQIIFCHYKFARQFNQGSFNTTFVKTLSEKKLLQNDCKIKYVLPLVSIDGHLFLSDERVYMQPLHPQILGKSVINIKLQNIKELFKRRYTLMDIGIEIMSKNEKGKKKSMYLIFQNTQERDLVYQTLHNRIDKSCVTQDVNVEHFTQQWLNSELSNFDYLMLLNSYAQRSF